MSHFKYAAAEKILHLNQYRLFRDCYNLKMKSCIILGELTNALVDHLNVGVAQAYLNQKRLDAEAKRLHCNATEFAKQTQNWISLVDSFNGSLKELGDVKSWATAIETDMKTVSSVLEYTYKVNKQATIQQQPSSAASSSVDRVMIKIEQRQFDK